MLYQHSGECWAGVKTGMLVLLSNAPLGVS